MAHAKPNQLFRWFARRSGGDPLDQQLRLLAIGCEALAPFVIELPGRLEQKQTALRVGEIDAAAFEFADDCSVVGSGIAAEERQLQAAAARGSAVAGAGIAARFGQHRQHLRVEIDRCRRCGGEQQDESVAVEGHGE